MIPSLEVPVFMWLKHLSVDPKVPGSTCMCFSLPHLPFWRPTFFDYKGFLYLNFRGSCAHEHKSRTMFKEVCMYVLFTTCWEGGLCSLRNCRFFVPYIEVLSLAQG